MPDRDLTHVPFVTIDPEGATDLDQALYLERNDTDTATGYRVYYAIADLPSLVEPGGAIDAEARKRGQTMYAPDGRIPLHPTIISEGVGSLLPDELRSAFVWEFELDAAANVTRVHVERARVRSRRQCSYVEVQAELDGADAGAWRALPSGSSCCRRWASSGSRSSGCVAGHPSTDRMRRCGSKTAGTCSPAASRCRSRAGTRSSPS